MLRSNDRWIFRSLQSRFCLAWSSCATHRHLGRFERRWGRRPLAGLWRSSSMWPNGTPDRDSIIAFFWDISYDQRRGARTWGFYTLYGEGFGFGESLPEDRLSRIEGAGSLILLRRLAGCRSRIICASCWRQTVSPSYSTWVDIIMDAIVNTEAQTQTIRSY